MTTSRSSPPSRSSSGPRQRGGPFRGGRRGFRRGRRVCFFCVDHVDTIDYKSVNRLRRYISDRARIDSAKKCGNCAKHQRVVRRAILRARFMALLPYAPDHVRVTNNLAPRQSQGPKDRPQRADEAQATPQPEADKADETKDEAQEAVTEPVVAERPVESVQAESDVNSKEAGAESGQPERE